MRTQGFAAGTGARQLAFVLVRAWVQLVAVQHLVTLALVLLLQALSLRMLRHCATRGRQPDFLKGDQHVSTKVSSEDCSQVQLFDNMLGDCAD